MFPHNTSAQPSSIDWPQLLSNLTSAVPWHLTNNGSLCVSPRALVNPPVYSGVTAIKAVDLEMLLLAASAHGYYNHFAGTVPYNWQNPNDEDFGKLKRDKLALEEQARALYMENYKLKKKVDSQVITNEKKVAEKDLAMRNMDVQLIEQALEINELKKQLGKKSIREEQQQQQP